MSIYIHLFFRALLLTITIETAVLAVFFFIRKRSELSRGLFIRVFIAGVVASGLTLPFVWFVFPCITNERNFFLVGAELFAFFAEIPIIRVIVKTTWFEAIVASLLANSVSFMCGFLMGIS